PGVTSTLLGPAQAVYYLEQLTSAGMEIAVAGIAGPGDACATPQTTLETLRRVRERFPDMLLCLATNGLELAPLVPEFARIGVSHITVTVNAIDPDTVEKIYAWIRYGRRVLRGEEMAACIIERQCAALRALQKAGITTKVNCIVIPGVNDRSVIDIAQSVAAFGVARFNAMPLIPTPDTDFASIPRPDHELMQTLRWEASRHLPIMRHCGHCRADAAGRIGQATGADAAAILAAVAAGPLNPGELRPCVAVASREGVLINAHLGQVEELFIYKKENGVPVLAAVRPAPQKGTGDARWAEMGETLADCHTLLAYRAGDAPRRVLEKSGLRVVETEGLIDGIIGTALDRGQIAERTVPLACGGGCGGNGLGCG
ncbi:MAG: radical SAM protein, partial [Chitinispirillaceae bacterium]|nr:radical SAM protein [Chitinispirillaceae bacterium]